MPSSLRPRCVSAEERPANTGRMVMHNPPRRVSEDPLKALEDEAYEAAAEEEGPRTYRHDYGHLGPAISEKPYRPTALREWPIHTDFRPDEVETRD
jgi:hypothetical protein